MSTPTKLPTPTRSQVKAAKKLAGSDWFSLTSEETRLAIVLQRVYGILSRAMNGQVGQFVYIPTRAIIRAAKKLAGCNWHTLSDQQTSDAIMLRHVYRLLGDPVGWFIGPFTPPKTTTC